MFKDRDISDYLEDIRGAIAEVGEFTKGMTFENFATDKKTINAVGPLSANAAPNERHPGRPSYWFDILMQPQPGRIGGSR